MFEVAASLAQNPAFFPRQKGGDPRADSAGRSDPPGAGAPALPGDNGATPLEDPVGLTHLETLADLRAQKQFLHAKTRLLAEFVRSLHERSRRLRLDICFNQDHVCAILQSLVGLQKNQRLVVGFRTEKRKSEKTPGRVYFESRGPAPNGSNARRGPYWEWHSETLTLLQDHEVMDPRTLYQLIGYVDTRGPSLKPEVGAQFSMFLHRPTNPGSIFFSNNYNYFLPEFLQGSS